MSLAKDLMQLGIPDQAALRLGFQTGTLTGAGTTNADAAVMNKATTLLQVNGAANSGVKLPADAELGVDYVIASITTNTPILVYPPTGGNLNGDTTTTGTASLLARASMICVRVNSTDWAVVIGAAG